MTPTLTSIIAGTIPLRQGRADCPFCEDLRPATFTIDEEGGRWSCTNCGASGDARDFLRRFGAEAAIRWLDRQEGKP